MNQTTSMQQGLVSRYSATQPNISVHNSLPLVTIQIHALVFFYKVHFSSPPSTPRFSKPFVPLSTQPRSCTHALFNLYAVRHQRFYTIKGLYNIL